jgi:Bacterial Ig-like domain
MTVDVDTKAGARRFFSVDTQAGKAEYFSAFEKQPLRVAGAAPKAASNPPKILLTKPVNGATDVDPALTEITVTFDQDMEEGFSWTGGGPEYPNMPEGQKPQWRGKRTCVMPVKLEAGHHYRVGINAPSYRNFRSTAGESAEISSINFTTK